MPYSVLVVEDDPNILLSLQFLMNQAGFEVRVARDGEAALREIDHSAPDVVLLDVMLPEYDGHAVCQAVRANPAWKDVRIVMLTARGREVDRETGLALGADGYITKPFSNRELVTRIKEIVGSVDG
jgi:DNA-binding response OmpR family regulator